MLPEERQAEFKRIMQTPVAEKFQFPRQRITKKAFEQKFMQVANGRDCYTTPHTENGWEDDHPTVTKMHLYYIEDAHAATWCKGEGWIFSDEQILKTKTQNDFMNEVYPDYGERGEA